MLLEIELKEVAMPWQNVKMLGEKLAMPW